MNFSLCVHERAACSRQGFQGEFLWPGTTDATAWLAVPAALAVVNALGPGTQAAHARKMLAAAVPLLQAAFGTTVTLGVPNSNTKSLVCVRHTLAEVQQHCGGRVASMPACGQNLIIEQC